MNNLRLTALSVITMMMTSSGVIAKLGHTRFAAVRKQHHQLGQANWKTNYFSPFWGKKRREQMILRKMSLSLLVGAFVVMSMLSSHTAQADRASISTSPVITLSDFKVVAGASSKIVRNDNGVTLSVSTTVDPGAYTMWMLLWNDPSECHGSDGLVCDPEVDKMDCVLFVAGHVVGNNGTLNYTGHRRVYDSSGAIGPFECKNGLVNPQGAAIHLIIRSHGPKQPGQVKSQISTVGGGCIPGSPDDPCDDVQAAAHEL